MGLWLLNHITVRFIDEQPPSLLGVSQPIATRFIDEWRSCHTRIVFIGLVRRKRLTVLSRCVETTKARMAGCRASAMGWEAWVGWSTGVLSVTLERFDLWQHLARLIERHQRVALRGKLVELA